MEDEASEISGALAVNSDGTIVLVDGTQVRDGLAACCFLFVGSSGVSSEHPGLHPTVEATAQHEHSGATGVGIRHLLAVVGDGEQQLGVGRDLEVVVRLAGVGHEVGVLWRRNRRLARHFVD